MINCYIKVGNKEYRVLFINCITQEVMYYNPNSDLSNFKMAYVGTEGMYDYVYKPIVNIEKTFLRFENDKNNKEIKVNFKEVL